MARTKKSDVGSRRDLPTPREPEPEIPEGTDALDNEDMVVPFSEEEEDGGILEEYDPDRHELPSLLDDPEELEREEDEEDDDYGC